MNQHVRRCKTVNKLVVLNAVNVMLLNLILFGLRMTIRESLRHRPNEKRTATACHIKNDRVLVHVTNLGHEVRDMVRCKSLVLIGLANVFVKRDEEQIEQVLPGRALVVNERENPSLDKVKNHAKTLAVHITNILAFKNPLIN